MHVLDSLNRGGSETLLLDVCRNARAHGLEVTLVAIGGGDLEDEFAASGAGFVRLERRAPFDLRVVKQLRREIESRGVQVVHSHQAVEALHAHAAASGTRAKRVISHHLCPQPDAKNRLAMRFLVPRADANVAVSRDLLRCLAAQQGFDATSTRSNFHTIYNGVDERRFAGADGRKLRSELGVAAGDVLLGMIGNFYPGVRKDHMTLCRALPKVFEHAPRARFVFVGGRSRDAPEVYDGCVRYCREAGIDGRVDFLGRRADIPDVLAALDIFVMSSLWEGMPIAVIEAMMMERAVVVSDIESLIEVTGGEPQALPFRTGDAGDLARKMSSLIDNSARRALLGTRAKEWAAHKFGIGAHLAGLKKLYSSLLGAGVGDQGALEMKRAGNVCGY